MAARGTPRQGIRIDPELWEEFGEAVRLADPPAERPEIIRQLIRWYVHRPGAKPVKRPPKP